MSRKDQAGSGPAARVIPLGEVPQVACSVVAAHLLAVLQIPARVTRSRPLPASCRLPARGQVDAARVLALLADGLAPGELRVGITAADLCLPMLTHVYGEARVGGGVAVVSLYRLYRLGQRPVRGPGQRPGPGPGQRPVRDEGGPAAVDGDLVAAALERLAKVAVHEAAHARGLVHCRSPGCVMCAALGLPQLDALALRFCRECRQGWARLSPLPVVPAVDPGDG
jgi:archaemetzincin